MDIQSILAAHRSKSNDYQTKRDKRTPVPTSSLIPDLFFDDILIRYKLGRIEIVVMMFLYRQVWCRPNLYQKYGIGPILSHSDMADGLGLKLEDIHQTLRKLESWGLIQTVRSGQYFVRKYFIKEFDREYMQNYENL
ncbi:MAG: hypothetical protein OXB88_09545 [Bacteriovoracales bacterium]|nr:hypothetical protein [Bacteriovoracales bacterium]